MKTLPPYSLRSNLAALLVGAALALGATAATQAAPIVITVTGTVQNRADFAFMGYTSGQTVSFNWTLNDYDPQTPFGVDGSQFGYYRWVKYGVTPTPPTMWTNVGGTGISGTYRDIQTADDRLQVQKQGSNVFEIFMKTDSFNTGSNNRGLYLSADSTYLIKELNFYGSIASPFPEASFVPGLPNPIDYMSGYFGTYNVTYHGSDNFYILATDGTSIKRTYFTATSVSWGVPDTGPQGLLAVGAMGLMVALRRRQSRR